MITSMAVEPGRYHGLRGALAKRAFDEGLKETELAERLIGQYKHPGAIAPLIGMTYNSCYRKFRKLGYGRIGHNKNWGKVS